MLPCLLIVWDLPTIPKASGQSERMQLLQKPLGQLENLDEKHP